MLDLSGLNIGVDGTYVIANALMYKNSVRALDISLNNIGDDGAQAMAETMRMNTVLEVRSMTRPSMTHPSMTHHQLLPHPLTHLSMTLP